MIPPLDAKMSFKIGRVRINFVIIPEVALLVSDF